MYRYVIIGLLLSLFAGQAENAEIFKHGAARGPQKDPVRSLDVSGSAGSALRGSRAAAARQSAACPTGAAAWPRSLNLSSASLGATARGTRGTIEGYIP